MDLTRIFAAIAVAAAMLCVTPAFAAEPDPFGGRLLPIEVVMAFRKEIDLSKAQSDQIGALVVDLQQGIAGKQWAMQSTYFELIEALDAAPVDESRTLALVKRAVDTENEIKLEQVRMLIRLRNLLTEPQVQFLRQRLAEGWTKDK
ncbi:MAG: hypothetical protein HC809_06835 [Gammaproteobacteria bacterium]|nr:hypothetical protein [Gammaproteobacteria bacterium]